MKKREVEAAAVDQARSEGYSSPSVLETIKQWAVIGAEAAGVVWDSEEPAGVTSLERKLLAAEARIGELISENAELKEAHRALARVVEPLKELLKAVNYVHLDHLRP